MLSVMDIICGKEVSEASSDEEQFPLARFCGSISMCFKTSRIMLLLPVHWVVDIWKKKPILIDLIYCYLLWQIIVTNYAKELSKTVSDSHNEWVFYNLENIERDAQVNDNLIFNFRLKVRKKTYFLLSLGDRRILWKRYINSVLVNPRSGNITHIFLRFQKMLVCTIFIYYKWYTLHLWAIYT